MLDIICIILALLGGIVGLAIILVVYACCVVAGRADRHIEYLPQQGKEKNAKQE